MADGCEGRKVRFLTLQKRLKEERLFVKQEKEQLRKLNEKVFNLSQNLFFVEWKTRHHWINVDRLVRGKVNPPECSSTSRIIENVKFEDACSFLNYEDTKYGEFLLSLKENPRLVALILDYCDNKKIKTTTRHLTKLLISSLYGSCVQRKDEIAVLKILKGLMTLQVLSCEDLLGFFCGKRSTDNAFACVLTLYSEVLFSAKLYLTAALHGIVMQVIVDDAIFLDVEVSKVLNRIPPKATKEKFGTPGTESCNNKIKEHMNVLHNRLVLLSKKFLKNLQDKIYCFPQSLRWAIRQLYDGMLTKMKLPQANAKAIIGYMIMSYFVCPAIINPEPYGINSDADISETARHNLSQIASILRSLALLECGLKDEKLKSILGKFDQGIILSLVTAVLHGSENIEIKYDQDISCNITQSSILMTEHELKTLIQCLKLLQSFNVSDLIEEGLEELLDTLPPPPKRWSNESTESDTISMKSECNNEGPVPPPRTTKMKKQNSTASIEMGKSQKEMDSLKDALHEVITEDQPVLIIPYGLEVKQQPGMLSEDKILGLENVSTNTFELEATEEDKKRRASSLMLDALSEIFPGGNQTGQLIDLGDNDHSSSSFDDSYEENLANPKKISSKPVVNQNPISDGLDAVFFSHVPTETQPAHNVPVDNLLDFNDVKTSPPPQLPQKNKTKEPISEGPKLPEKQKYMSTVLNDEPLISLENDIFSNETSDKVFGSTPTTPNRQKRISNASMLSSAGGINDILKHPAIPSPTTVKNSEFGSPWSPSTNSTDPWATSNPDTQNTKTDSNAFENDFAPQPAAPAPPLRSKFSPSAKKKHSIDPNYAEYSENIQREKQLNNTKLHESNSTENIGKLSRKKSHGAWLKDKISSKLATGLRTNLKTFKSDSRKEPLENNGRQYESLNAPKSPPLLPGTPMEASEVSKIKSASILSRGSAGSGETSPIMDVSEAILAKYRTIVSNTSSTMNQNELVEDPEFGSPMTSQMETMVSQVRRDEIVFDEEFKFDDAKRKLRTVLCTSDETALPGDAINFDQLLLTMLQGKLAEAINLQNRFSVAQLHETLRSIKQLPKGSCDKLIAKLESDYELRSKYISYLIRSKQGLLSIVSYLEHVTAKVMRDQTICRKYFTTLSVRLFMETPECKLRISHFGQKFISTKLLDEKEKGTSQDVDVKYQCTLLSNFLEDLHHEMVKDSTWSYCTDEELEDVTVATERAIMSRVYKEAFYPNGVTDIENDRIFHEHIKCLSTVITLSHPLLQIPKMYQKEAPWPSAQTELLMVNAYKTAADKLSCIHRCCVTIMNLLSMASEKNQAPGADDFVPVLVYVVLRANPPNLLSTKQYVNTFYETRLSGEQYYCWMQFCAAVEFIKTMRSPER